MSLDKKIRILKLKPGKYKLKDFFDFQSGISSFSMDKYPVRTKLVPEKFVQKLYKDARSIWRKFVRNFFGVWVCVDESPSRIKVRKRINHEKEIIPVPVKTNGIKLVKHFLFGINDDEIWIKSIHHKQGEDPYQEETAINEMPYFSNTFSNRIEIEGVKYWEVSFHALCIDWSL